MYKDFSYEGECKSFLLTNKWDGYALVISFLPALCRLTKSLSIFLRTNVLVFKYTDAAGKNFISMKSKGSVYLTNGPFGKLSSLLDSTLIIRYLYRCFCDSRKEGVGDSRPA